MYTRVKLTRERVVSHIEYHSLQHGATQCNTLQRSTSQCNKVQHSVKPCNTLQRTGTHCNTLQHPATHCNTLQHTAPHRPGFSIVVEENANASMHRFAEARDQPEITACIQYVCVCCKLTKRIFFQQSPPHSHVRTHTQGAVLSIGVVGNSDDFHVR